MSFAGTQENELTRAHTHTHTHTQSGLEAEKMRSELGEKLMIVTPGIRPGDNVVEDDQKRVMTAGKAVAAGADHLVVGRPITKAEDPIKVIESMQQEIAAVTG